jgi:ketosteroid isomerase-like protein
MSQENVETVRRFFEAWNRGDVAAFMRLTRPDGEFLLPRNILEGGSYRGLDRIAGVRARVVGPAGPIGSARVPGARTRG